MQFEGYLISAICFGVDFLHFISNEISLQFVNIQDLKAFAETDSRDCFIFELISGVSQMTEL